MLNCLSFFFPFEEKIQSKATYCRKKYGVLLVFQAGVHLGNVAVAEVGIVKSDITFHGHMLNTAAHIQGECNKYQSKMFASADFVQRATQLKGCFVQVKELGAITAPKETSSGKNLSARKREKR